MAKLDVKVIDMQGGEIMKVAYDGAEYAPVDSGKVESTSDILQAKYSHWDRKEGEFYRVVNASSHVCWIEDDGSENGVAAEHINSRFKVFRKISASSPTIEERVTALEADVATIKGNKAGTTKRLTVGDKARVVGRESAHSAEIGDIVTIVRDDEDRQPYKCELDGENVGWFKEWELEAVDTTKYSQSEKWTKVGRKLGEYKKGDIVRVKRSRPCGANRRKGYVGEIVSYHSNASFKVGAEDAGWMSAYDVELITPVDARFDK